MNPFDGWVRPLPPAEAAPAGRADRLTVMSYNIRHGRGMDGVIDLPRLAEVIAGAQAAVVGLNEVDIKTERSSGVDQPGTLGELLGMHVVYGPNIEYQGGLYGNATLSRYPVVAARNIPLPAGGRRRWGLLHTVVDLGGVRLHHLVTHLSLEAAERQEQLRQILDAVAELEGPVVLMGDFNIVAGTDEDPSFALGPDFTDAYVAAAPAAAGGPEEPADPGYTFPSDQPSRRIDYIFLRGPIRVAGPGAVRTIPTQASDHLPLVAELVLA